MILTVQPLNIEYDVGPSSATPTLTLVTAAIFISYHSITELLLKHKLQLANRNLQMPMPPLLEIVVFHT